MKNNRVEWYHGFGNIVTIILFISGMLPFAVITMWLFSNWNKKTKIIFTLLPVSLLVVIYLGLYAGKFLFSDSMRSMTIYRSVINYGVPGIFISLLISILLTIFSKQLNLEYRKIWIIELAILFVLVVIIFFFAMSSVGSIYSVTK